MEKSTRCRPPSFKVEIPGDAAFKELFMGKINQVHEILVKKLQQPANNGDVLGAALDACLHQCGASKKQICVSTATPLEEEETEQELCLISRPSIEKLIQVTRDTHHMLSTFLGTVEGSLPRSRGLCAS